MPSFTLIVTLPVSLKFNDLFRQLKMRHLGITEFFKRKFDFVSVERVPRFCDVKREYNMDEDLKASGYTKTMEKELEQELRPINEEEETESNQDDEEEDDDDEKSASEEEEVEEKTEESKKDKKTNVRLDNWLDG